MIKPECCVIDWKKHKNAASILCLHHKLHLNPDIKVNSGRKITKGKLPEGINELTVINCFYYACKHCGQINLLSTPDGVTKLRKWKKQITMKNS